MFDFFKLPTDFPGYNDVAKISDPYKKANHLEKEWSKDINQINFIPYISLHEFEALLFSELKAFEDWFEKETVDKLRKEIDQFQTPEHVNNGSETAPSKRILKYCPDYEKPLHGSIIAQSIGLEKIRNQCTHFDNWLKKLENL